MPRVSRLVQLDDPRADSNGYSSFHWEDRESKVTKSLWVWSHRANKGKSSVVFDAIWNRYPGLILAPHSTRFSLNEFKNHHRFIVFDNFMPETKITFMDFANITDGRATTFERKGIDLSI